MIYHSPIGDIRIHAQDGKILSVDFSVINEKDISDSKATDMSEPSRKALKTAIDWLDIYFSGQIPNFLPPLSPQGTPFQQKVWTALLQIPYGTTVSYADIAQSIGCRSAQAVGQAIGKNPICIMIPCHRVIGKNGNLTGFAWGIETKRQLLDIESSKR